MSYNYDSIFTLNRRGYPNIILFSVFENMIFILLPHVSTLSNGRSQRNDFSNLFVLKDFDIIMSILYYNV